jgi:hypothetical protein
MVPQQDISRVSVEHAEVLKVIDHVGQASLDFVELPVAVFGI